MRERLVEKFPVKSISKQKLIVVARVVSLVCRMAITRALSWRGRESFALYIMNSYRWICAQYKHESLSPLPAKVVWPICCGRTNGCEMISFRWPFISKRFGNSFDGDEGDLRGGMFNMCLPNDVNYSIRRSAAVRGKKCVKGKVFAKYEHRNKLLNW